MDKIEIWLNAVKQLEQHLQSKEIQNIIDDVLEEKK